MKSIESNRSEKRGIDRYLENFAGVAGRTVPSAAGKIELVVGAVVAVSIEAVASVYSAFGLLLVAFLDEILHHLI